LAIVVSDSSPLRALAQLDRLTLLRDLFGEVIVPPAVIAELEQPQSKLPLLSIRQLPFVRVQAPSDRAVVDELLGIFPRVFLSHPPVKPQNRNSARHLSKNSASGP
jgi:hypothetical protein